MYPTSLRDGESNDGLLLVPCIDAGSLVGAPPPRGDSRRGGVGGTTDLERLAEVNGALTSSCSRSFSTESVLTPLGRCQLIHRAIVSLQSDQNTFQAHKTRREEMDTHAHGCRGELDASAARSGLALLEHNNPLTFLEHTTFLALHLEASTNLTLPNADVR